MELSDDILFSKTLLKKNVEEENEKLKLEKEEEKIIKLNGNRKSEKNLNLIDSVRVKLLRNEIKRNLHKRNISTINATTESPIKKKNHDDIFLTIPNIPIKENPNIKLMKEFNFENFMNESIEKIKKEKEKDLKKMNQIKKEMFNYNNKDYISYLYSIRKSNENISRSILNNIYNDLLKIKINGKKKESKLKNRRTIILPPLNINKNNIENRESKSLSERKNSHLNLINISRLFNDKKNES
jgi:hypothetical protein